MTDNRDIRSATDGQTDFHRWRKQMGFTITQSAKALGISVSQANNYESGTNRGRGTPAHLSLSVRLAMSAISADLAPWQ